ncbi:hypothetical protein [Undibacterium terreum]|uniref:Uncharacterized protein n=1 Tax=Undibacterium terreum TaxID=1224302 RepID=A0A916UBT9_9BURK|nr:hypothetical protein [Undibacterium terreum]GGC66066.1 hypothetical protein GCM10011396_11330 [Undibacterium terreum]
MPSEKLQASWAISIGYLASARLQLPQRLNSPEAEKAHAQFNEYLDHNELGLALEEAEALGSLCNAPPAFWRELQLAAANMQRAENEARYAALANA